jgi:putative endonuclease
VTNQKQDLGRWGEDIAVNYLETHGYQIQNRNVQAAHGEIDIVAKKDQLLVFVEVKTRSSHSFAYPETSVTARKQAHMLSAAEEYFALYPDCGETWQFDVIAIERKPGGKTQIEHFENVIS